MIFDTPNPVKYLSIKKVLKSQIKGWIFMPVLIKKVEEGVKCKGSKIPLEPVRG